MIIWGFWGSGVQDVVGTRVEASRVWGLSCLEGHRETHEKSNAKPQSLKPKPYKGPYTLNPNPSKS